MGLRQGSEPRVFLVPLVTIQADTNILKVSGWQQATPHPMEGITMSDRNERIEHLSRLNNAFTAEGDFEAAEEVSEELAYLSQRVG